MKLKIAGLLLSIVALAASGCSATLTAGQNQPLPPLASTAATLGADAAAVEFLKGVNPADRPATAQVVSDIGKAIQGAASTPPDFTALNALVSQKLAAWNSPYAPLVEALAQQVLADAEAQAASPSTQGAAAAALVKATGLGLQFGAQGFIQP